MITELTKEQKIALTGFTGLMLHTSFAEYHEDVEKRLGEPVFTHQFADEGFAEKIAELYREDVMKMCGVSKET